MIDRNERDERHETSRRSVLRGLSIAGSSIALSAAGAAGESAAPAREIEHHRDITFTERENVSSVGPFGESSHTDGELRLDLYLPETNNPHPLPVLVYMHGGAWLFGAKDSPEQVPMFEHFAQRGFAVASIEYRLAWEETFPAQIRDVNTAIQWLRANADEYNLDRKNIATWGTSAGAHLSALAGVTNEVDEFDGTHPSGVGNDVQGAISWYGIMDLEMMEETAHPDTTNTYEDPQAPESVLMGENLGDGEETGDYASPITYLDPDDPPLLLYHGNDDRTVGYGQSVLMYERAKELCHDTTFYELHGIGHSSEEVFGALTSKPGAEATVRTTHCRPASNERVKEGPVATIEDMERFLRRNLRN